jgi:hypothetical protein
MQLGMASPPPAHCSAWRIFETEQREDEIAAMERAPRYSRRSPPLSGLALYYDDLRTIAAHALAGSANSYRTPRIR